MRFPKEWYQMEHSIAQHFPDLRLAQQRALTLWVYGASRKTYLLLQVSFFLAEYSPGPALG